MPTHLAVRRSHRGEDAAKTIFIVAGASPIRQQRLSGAASARNLRKQVNALPVPTKLISILSMQCGLIAARSPVRM